jgi:hypothetical protein
MIVLPRKTIATELEMLGYTPEKYMLVHQENGFIPRKRFNEWTRVILIPHIAQRRRDSGYEGRAVLLLDGCKCHDTDELREERGRAEIHAVFIPPHTSHIIQALDLGIFGVFKLFCKRNPRFQDLPVFEHQAAQVLKICDAWQRATIPRNIVGAFRAAGLVPYPGSDHHYYLQFNEAEAKRLHEEISSTLFEDAVESGGGDRSFRGKRRLRLE